MKKNRVLALALAVCLIAIMAFGSLAYFTAKDNVVNTFQTTSTDPNAILFALDVYETDLEGNKTETGVTYEDILPGTVVSKDPTVKNTGLYPQYVRLNITVSHADAWKTSCARHNITDLATIFGGFNNDWVQGEITEDTGADTLTYTYYLTPVLNPGDTSTIFETVTIPAAFTIADMNNLKEFTLTIVGQAIQSENTAGNAKDAFKYWTEP